MRRPEGILRSAMLTQIGLSLISFTCAVTKIKHYFGSGAELVVVQCRKMVGGTDFPQFQQDYYPIDGSMRR
jgi:hypothetical protein